MIEEAELGLPTYFFSFLFVVFSLGNSRMKVFSVCFGRITTDYSSAISTTKHFLPSESVDRDVAGDLAPFGNDALLNLVINYLLAGLATSTLAAAKSATLFSRPNNIANSSARTKNLSLTAAAEDESERNKPSYPNKFREDQQLLERYRRYFPARPNDAFRARPVYPS